jgi:RimJ/RimL family protein N-acetyltransferase
MLSLITTLSRYRRLFFSIFNRSDDQFIGDVYYGTIDWTVPYFAIGYWIDSRQSGKGYMTEAVNALARLGL